MNKFLWKIPIQWDSKQKKFDYVLGKSLITKSSMIICEVLLFLVGVGTTGLFLVFYIFSPEKSHLTPLHYSLYLISLTGDLFIFTETLIVYRNGKDLANILNQLLQLQFDLTFRWKSKTSKSSRKFSLWKVLTDPLGLLLHFAVLFFTVLPFVIPFIVYLELDPVFQLIRYTIRMDDRLSSLSISLRIFIQTYLFFGASRLAALTIILIVILLKTFVNCSIMLEKHVTSKIFYLSGFRNSLQKYLRFFMLLQLGCKEGIAICVLILTALGIGLEIITVFIVIKVRSLALSYLPIYIAIAFSSIAIPAFSNLSLSDAIKTPIKTANYIRLWKLRVSFCRNSTKKTVCQRTLRSIRYCYLYAGIGELKFYPVLKSLRTTYFSIMVYYTMTALLSASIN